MGGFSGIARTGLSCELKITNFEEQELSKKFGYTHWDGLKCVRYRSLVLR